MQFPLYAKHPSGQVWYRIDSQQSFTELRKLGQRVTKSEIRSKDYSTSLYIKDLIDALMSKSLESVSEAEYKSMEAQAL